VLSARAQDLANPAPPTAFHLRDAKIVEEAAAKARRRRRALGRAAALQRRPPTLHQTH
jgi:hypothetical protein